MKTNLLSRPLFAALFALVMCTAFVSPAAANPEKVATRVLQHFSTTFATAENVIWKHTPDFSKATFTRNNQRMEVFYNHRDELMVTATYIDLNSLPCPALSVINGKYEGYKCTSAVKCVDADGTVAYYTELQNDKKNVILKTDLDGFTTVFSSARR